MPILTNPAAELYALCIDLRSTTGKSTADVISDILGIEKDSAVFFSALSAIVGRFELVKTLVDDLPHWPDAQKVRTKSAIEHLSRIFSTGRLQAGWADNVKHFFPEEHLIRLEYSTSLMQIIAPISIPTSDERKDFIKQIEESITALEQNPTIISKSIISHLQSLKTILDKFHVFGIEKLSETLSIAGLEISTALHSKNASGNTASWKKGIKKAAIAIGAIATSLIVVDNTATAIENFYSRAQPAIGYISELVDSEIKLLPPPTTNDSKPSDQPSP